MLAEDIGIPVSVDLNYRRQLWSHDQAALVLGGLETTLRILPGPTATQSGS